MSQLGWSQDVLQHPWDPMVGIPTQPERGCGWLIYVGLDCSYDEHMEESHPMYGGSWNFTCIGYAQSFD
jgi:hypothetical protein